MVSWLTAYAKQFTRLLVTAILQMLPCELLSSGLADGDHSADADGCGDAQRDLGAGELQGDLLERLHDASVVRHQSKRHLEPTVPNSGEPTQTNKDYSRKMSRHRLPGGRLLIHMQNKRAGPRAAQLS